MKKKRTMIIAGILTGALLMCIAVPAALAKGEDESPNDAARTEITLRENDRHNAEPEIGMPNGEDDISDKNTNSTKHARHGGHGENAKPEEPEAPENAIGKDAAKQIALSDAGLSSEQVEKVKARLSDKDGTLVYKVSFKYDGQRYSYKIAPVSGDILDKSVQEAAEHIREGHGQHTHADEVNAPTQVENGVMEGI